MSDIGRHIILFCVPWTFGHLVIRQEDIRLISKKLDVAYQKIADYAGRLSIWVVEG